MPEVQVRFKMHLVPEARLRVFVEPLLEALATELQPLRGGSEFNEAGEAIGGELVLEVADPAVTVPRIIAKLTQLGVSEGTTLHYLGPDGASVLEIFGTTQGLGLYLNSTDLPDAVYRRNDINELVLRFDKALKDRVRFQGHWDGPRETALYWYGQSRLWIRKGIAPLVASHPLCALARIEDLDLSGPAEQTLKD